MSQRREERSMTSATPMTLDDLARAQGARETRDPKELEADIWESDEELDAFLADLRTCRDSSAA